MQGEVKGSLRVCNEIGQLKKVLLHKPGKELEHLVPEELERLLFDDIPYLAKAREEHDAFADTLRQQGVQVLYLDDLAAQTLKFRPELKSPFLKQLIREGGSKASACSDELYEYLSSIRDEKELILKTMAGVSSSELRIVRYHPLAELVQRETRFLLDPLPNLYFTRDPFAVIGNGVSLNRMHSVTRNRETIYGQYILNYHPDFAPGLKLYYHREDTDRIEGGDILVLSPEVLAVGISQRTSPEAIEVLARNIFDDQESAFRTILALDIPSIRAYMHLDTVLTQLDRSAFLVHPGILGMLRVFEIRPGSHRSLLVREMDRPLEYVLAEYLGLDRVTLIRCGGNNRVASEREQWNDGSNTLCVRPGTVITYERNDITNQLLREKGICVLEIPGSELSRGRGGPRCMSMPLERELK